MYGVTRAVVRQTAWGSAGAGRGGRAVVRGPRRGAEGGGSGRRAGRRAGALLYLHQWSQTQGHGPVTDALVAPL